MKRFFLVLVALAIGAVLGSHLSPRPVVRSVSAAPATVWRTEEEQRTIEMYKRTNEAVVFISTIVLAVDPFDLFFEVQPREGTGSGFIIDAKKGIILTNLHVLQEAQRIQIFLASGQPYEARLLGFDKEFDIAVLQLVDPPATLRALPLGDSASLEVGQRVFAIGNPFGLNRTLTRGIISSLDRTVRGPNGVVLRGLVQTDASINPGNSGGPLLDGDGNVIGINTAILSQSGDSAGIGFAVPINQIKRVLPELVATGKVLRPKMGWILVDTDQGPMVRRVAPGGPADEAGLQPLERMVENVFMRGYVSDPERADLIFKVNGRRVQSREEVEELVQRTKGRGTLRLTLRRGGIQGAEREVTVQPRLG
ncbi:MAG: trypsin-like peptidase domain-containing protein [Bdellovibrionota bacterium]|nr:MAG: trypsin-like peptidase domain-containing protein [Bdellovibrionota bacterium]